jgi:Dullard-like phosphatase family protein
MLKQIETV